jgi:hypothetical protein
MALVFWHSTLAERRVSKRFSIGAFFLSSLWAYSEGMTRLAGQLTLLDVLISFGAVALFFLLGENSMSLAAACLVVLAFRVFIGFRARQWLTEHLMSLGYKRAVSP